ncbi:MAG: sensor domain-containing diguanylate cyclase [Parcubacteria group bacterium]|nr:sensor domain-containing diguanylate cyclase [Parcubacteria group bacterium]
MELSGSAAYKKILDNLYDGVCFINRDKKIVYWNKGAEALTGFASDEAVGTRCGDSVSLIAEKRGINLSVDFCPISELESGADFSEREVYIHHKDGHLVPVLARAISLRDAGGEVIGAVQIFSENLSKNAAIQRIEELQRLALVDPLTGLANRRYAEINLRAKLDEMKRYGWQLGVLFADIDHFKRINDEYGHEAGDRVLKIVAKTFTHDVRSFDVAARWGGEEFLIVIESVTKNQLVAVAEKLRILVEQSSIPTDAGVIHPTISVGATIASPEDEQNSLLKRVDRLMYESKTTGRNRVTAD